MAETKWINANGGNWNTAGNWDNGVPTSTVDAVFDAASFAANGKVVTIDANASCLALITTNADQTFTISGSVYTLSVYGALTLSSNVTVTLTGTSYLYLKSTTSVNLTMGATTGRSFNRLYFDGVGGTWTCQDEMNVGGTTLFHTNGTWNINSKVVTCTSSYFTEAGTKTLTLGSGTFNILTWRNNQPTNFTFNYNTGTVVCTLQGSSTFSGSNTFYNLNIIGASTITSSFSFVDSIIVTNTLTITGNNSTTYRLLIASNTIGTPRTITCNGTITATNVDFRDITGAGSASWDLSAITGGSGDCGGNSGITFTTAQKQYFKHTSGAVNFSDSTKWFSDYSPRTTAGRVPLPQDDWDFDASSFTGTSTVSVNCPRIGRSCDMSGVNQAVTWSLANAIEVYGSYVLGSNITPSGAYVANALGRSNYYINTFNKSIESIHFNGPSSTYTFLSNHTQASYSYFFLSSGSSGTVDFNDFNISMTAIVGFNRGTLYLGNGLITLNTIASNSSFQFSYLYSENSTLKINGISGNNNILIEGYSKSFNKVQFSGSHTGNFDIAGSNTFAELIIDAGRKVRVTAGTTQTIAKLTASGTAGNVITLDTVSGSGQWTMNYTGTRVINYDYLNIKNCNLNKSLLLFAGINSVDSGNNAGWEFGAASLLVPAFSETSDLSSNIFSDVIFNSTFVLSDELILELITQSIIQLSLSEYENINFELINEIYLLYDLSENETINNTLICDIFSNCFLTEYEEINADLLSEFVLVSTLEENNSIYLDIILDVIIYQELSELELMIAEIRSPAIIIYKSGELIIIQSNVQIQNVMQSNFTIYKNCISNIEIKKTMYSKIF